MLKSLAVTVLVAGPAFASSDDAWAAFATEVEDACLAATGNALLDASAIVDPFGSESYGMAIVTGRTANDRSARMICVMDKETRAVQVGGELEITVTRAGLQPLSEHDITTADLGGELFCTFEAKIGPLLLAAGQVDSDQPAQAAVKTGGKVMSLTAPGGFDAMIDGAEFTGSEASARIDVTGDATEGGESPAHPATLTFMSDSAADLITEGLWRCGP